MHEGKQRVEDMVNYDEVRAAIAEKLESLHTVPNRWEVGVAGGDQHVGEEGVPPYWTWGGWACQEDALLDLDVYCFIPSLCTAFIIRYQILYCPTRCRVFSSAELPQPLLPLTPCPPSPPSQGGVSPHLPSRRRRDVPQHHPDQPAAGVGGEGGVEGESG